MTRMLHWTGSKKLKAHHLKISSAPQSGGIAALAGHPYRPVKSSSLLHLSPGDVLILLYRYWLKAQGKEHCGFAGKRASTFDRFKSV